LTKADQTAAAEPTGRGDGFRAFSPWLSLVVRLFLGAMWLYYSIPKLSQPSVNLASVQNFKLLSGGLATAFAYGQPYVELSLGLLLIFGLGTRLIAILSALLLLVYIGGIISLGARGIHVTCGCGGAGGQVAIGHTRYILDTLRDIGYLIPALWLIWQPKSKLSADAALLPDLPPPAPVPPPRSTAQAKNTTAKNGAAKNGTAKNGTAKNVQSKNVPDKNGTAKKGAPKPRTR
jgi:uncharacterized membrane protein YphA (DoxX/SURF4 family)